MESPELFVLDEDMELVITPYALSLKPFRAIMKKYRSVQKGINELMFIAHLVHPKSDFADITDEEERRKTILVSLVGANEIKFDKRTDDAIEFYRNRVETVKIKFLKSAIAALNKTKEYLDNVDYTLTDSKGQLIYNPNDVVRLIKESPKLMEGLIELEAQIRRDEEMQGDVRGSGKKGVYED